MNSNIIYIKSLTMYLEVNLRSYACIYWLSVADWLRLRAKLKQRSNTYFAETVGKNAF